MKQIKYYFLLLFIFLLCNNEHVVGQSYLDKTVTLTANNQPIHKVFKAITFQTGIIFSYSDFNDQQDVSKSYYKEKLRDVLDDLLLNSNYSWSIREKYIIIQSENPVQAPLVLPSIIQGYIRNIEDSSIIQNASVYNIENKKSTLSNEDGFFHIQFPESESVVSLSFAKENYYDASLVVYNEEEVTIYLFPRKIEVDTIEEIETEDTVPSEDSIKKPIPIGRIVGNKIRKDLKVFARLMHTNSNFKNISDTMFTKFSISLVPYLSTNKLLSINTVNSVALNLLIGYSKGINVAEIGGLLNIDNGNVKYCQIAGLANIVNGDVKYTQIGGLSNIVSGKFDGVQIGGLWNTVLGDFNGVQIGGLLNTCNKLKGLQLGGIYSQSTSTNGLQIGGISNWSKNKTNGFQVSGITNITDTLNGMQLTGLVNVANTTTGGQIAGLVNYAKCLNGFQLALVNIADSSNGVSVGFFNYVKKGYHKIEISQDELLFTTFGFRTGTDKFHNIFFIGVDAFSDEKLWSYGYGIGSAFRMSNKLYLATDISSQQIQSMDNNEVRLNLLNKLTISCEYRILQKLSIAVGPTYNIMISDATASDYSTTHDPLAPYSFYNETRNTHNIKMWVGGKISLKFF
jgi:hypothetical protein